MSKSSRSSSNPSKTMKDKAFAGVGSLIRLLPTGTVFLFQFLNPVLTNNGHCSTVNKYLSGALISLCGISACFSSFTDSYTDADGTTRYGVATTKGLWPSDRSSGDLSKYKLRVSDFVHGFLTTVVFAVVALLDSNTVECLYPSFESTEKVLMMVLPPVVGAAASSVFMTFPNKRHGIGYPPTQSSD